MDSLDMLMTRLLLALSIGLLAVPALAQADRQLTLGETVEGALTTDSDTLEDGRYVETYVLDAPEETAFEVVLQSDGFDTYLIVEGPMGEPVENDDWGGTSESRVAVGAGPPGRHEVRVTSYGVGGTGSFTLTTASLGVEAYQRQVRLAESNSLLGMSYDHFQQAEHMQAFALMERVLSIREAELGPDHPWVAESLLGLGTVSQARGDFEGALAFNERSLAIWEEALGPDHPDVAWALVNVAAVLEDLGDLERARGDLERALAIMEGAYGPHHVAVAEVADGLGVLLGLQGDVERAGALHERALAIREGLFGLDHPEVADALNSLGVNLVYQGAFDRARPLQERALAIWEEAHGPAHPRVALALNNLATTLHHLGEHDLAATRSARALAIWEETLGPAHPDVALARTTLAAAVYALGDVDRAISLHERSLEVWEGAFGSDHPWTALASTNLATVHSAKGNADTARGHALRAGQVHSVMVDRVFPTLSAAEQHAYAQVDLGAQTGALLSTHRSGATLPDAYALFGGWKGLLLDGLRRQGAIDRLASEPATAERVDRLRDLRTRVAQAYHDGDPGLADLTAEKEALERELLAALPDGAFRDPWAEGGLDGLRAALPADGALVDIYRYGHRERGEFVEWRYAAVVTGPAAGPTLVDLGSAEAIDAAVGSWRGASTRGLEAAAETAALAATVWNPIGDALPDGTTRVWASPDGPLAGVPWAVLAETVGGGEGRLVAQVPSARALLTLLTDTAPAPADPTALVVGGVAFGPGPDWDPLPATATEADVIVAMAAGGGIAVSRLDGETATVPAVASSLGSATYAHLATHGFVYAEPVPVREAREEALRSGSSGGRTPGAPGAQNWGRSPLALSGLALAGANTPDDAPGGGTLTAEELVGLDLSGTRLVALSACETGRGAEVAGQGVLGLQASLTATGARAVLMSLWSVPDASTSALMTAFYRGLWSEGRPPADALRRAQAEVRATPGWEAPLYWAGWVISGDAF